MSNSEGSGRPKLEGKNLDQDIGDVVRYVVSTRSRQVEDATDWLNCIEQGFLALLDCYRGVDRLDVLLDRFVNDFDCGGGDQFFIPASNYLIEHGEQKSLVRMWRGVIAQRLSAGMSDQASEAQGHLMNALSALSDFSAADSAKKEFERLLNADQILLAKPAISKIDDDIFWEIVRTVKDCSEIYQQRSINLEIELLKLSAKAIKEFAMLMHKKLDLLYRQDLWAFAYILNGGCGDDTFEYFRAWIISEGPERFQGTVENCESLVYVIEGQTLPQLESFLYAPHVAYLKRSGKKLGLKLPKAELIGREWQEDELEKLLPLAWQKYAG